MYLTRSKVKTPTTSMSQAVPSSPCECSISTRWCRRRLELCLWRPRMAVSSTLTHMKERKLLVIYLKNCLNLMKYQYLSTCRKVKLSRSLSTWTLFLMTLKSQSWLQIVRMTLCLLRYSGLGRSWGQAMLQTHLYWEKSDWNFQRMGLTVQRISKTSLWQYLGN